MGSHFFKYTFQCQLSISVPQWGHLSLFIWCLFGLRTTPSKYRQLDRVNLPMILQYSSQLSGPPRFLEHSSPHLWWWITFDFVSQHQLVFPVAYFGASITKFEMWLQIKLLKMPNETINYNTQWMGQVIRCYNSTLKNWFNDQTNIVDSNYL